jgi:hypothetical protein
MSKFFLSSFNPIQIILATKMQHILIKQGFANNHNFSNFQSTTFLSWSQLATWWQPQDTWILIFESCDDLNQCTSHRRNLINMTCTCSWQNVRGNLSRWLNRVEQIHCYRERGLLTTSSARRLNDLQVPTQFLSPHSHWSTMLKPSICWGQATSVYWAYISSMWSVRSILAHEYQPLGP